jgi:hypothetical protein
MTMKKKVLKEYEAPVVSSPDSLKLSVDYPPPPTFFDHVEMFQPVMPTPVQDKKDEAQMGPNPKDLVGAKKVQLNLVPASSIIYQALAMEDGARKYGPYNWRDNKVLASIYVAACMRHIAAWYDSREENATDSKKPHLGHALACLGIIVDALETGNLIDDRPTPGAAARLIAELEAKKKLETNKVKE